MRERERRIPARIAQALRLRLETFWLTDKESTIGHVEGLLSFGLGCSRGAAIEQKAACHIPRGENCMVG